MHERLYVGCQGWRYADWRAESPDGQLPLASPFYPPTLNAAQELAHYSRTFDLVEVDSTFYAIPQVKVVRNWGAQTPETFRFTLKLPRTLTHEYRLRRGRATLEEFCHCARVLETRLAAILIQLPPSFGFDEFSVLERFLPHLPTDLPFAIEFRDSAWLVDQTFQLLKTHRVALTLGDTPWIATEIALPLLDKLPTDWLYLRFMGPKSGEIEHFTHRQLDRESVLSVWAEALACFDSIRQVYALFDNHLEGFSPGSATLFKRKLGQIERPFPRDQPPPVQQLGLNL